LTQYYKTMDKKHPAKSKSMADTPAPLKETDKKKLELGDAMEHEHGQSRESTEEDIESLDRGDKRSQTRERR
jgi:hypothetical protein